MPVPVVIRLKLPATVGSLLRVKSALVVVKLALPPVVAEFSVNALLSVNAKSPLPVRDKIKLLKLVAQLRAAAALRREILALVAAKVRSRSASSRSLAFIFKAEDWVKPATGTIRLPVPVVVKFNVPATDVLAPRVKSALLVVRFTLPPLVAEFRFKPSVSVSVKFPAPVKARFKSLKLVFHVRAAEASRNVIFAKPAARVKSRSASNTSLALMVNAAG